MNDLLNALFNLENLRFGQEGVEFAFARPIPAWAWVLAGLTAVGVSVWSYVHLTGPKGIRAGLAVVRALLLLAILVLISGPQLVKPDEHVERDWVLVLADRSASMTIADAPGEAGARLTREAELRAVIERSWPMWSALGRERTVRWLGFDVGAYDLPIAATDAAMSTESLGTPDGRRTNIGAAIEQALRVAAARPISGIVIFSDGRSVDEPTRTAMRRLQSERIPVFVAPLGREEPLLDLAVIDVDAPTMAFLDDTVPLQVRLGRIGRATAPATVRLIDAATGMVLDETVVSATEEAWQDDEARVMLAVKPNDAGGRTWRVVVSTPTPDLIAENNSRDVTIEMVDRPLRVAYFDGYPRWEYRYVKNLLLRERSIRSSAMLLAANRRYLQEGDYPLVTLPRSPEEWADFDVIVLGDVRAELFSREQLEQIREHVASRGAGLLWIAGAGATPSTWIDTPLGDLLPFRAVSQVSGSPAIRLHPRPVVVRRTTAAERLGLLELSDVEGGASAQEGWPERLSDPATGWSKLQWAQQIDPESLKPTAEVLAVASSESLVAGPGLAAALEDASPLVISMRYGAGRVVYVATDEIWRWRYARGEELPERFWLPLMRLQGRESLARSGQSALLEVAPRRAVVDQPIRIAVTILDQSLAELQLPAIRVAVRRADSGDAESAPVTLRLTPEDTGATRTISQTYATTWMTSEAGTFVVETREPTLASLGLSTALEVMLPDDELRSPEADHGLLARLAEQTGGQVLTPDAIATLPDLLPNREVRIVGTPTIQTLWDHWVSLLLLFGLATVEWVVRKLIQLA